MTTQTLRFRIVVRDMAAAETEALAWLERATAGRDWTIAHYEADHVEYHETDDVPYHEHYEIRVTAQRYPQRGSLTSLSARTSQFFRDVRRKGRATGCL